MQITTKRRAKTSLTKMSLFFFHFLNHFFVCVPKSELQTWLDTLQHMNTLHNVWRVYVCVAPPRLISCSCIFFFFFNFQNVAQVSNSRKAVFADSWSNMRLSRSLSCWRVTELVSPSAGRSATHWISKHVHSCFYWTNVMIIFNKLKLHIKIEEKNRAYIRYKGNDVLIDCPQGLSEISFTPL